VATLHDQEVVQREGQYYVAVPGEWEGLREGKVLEIVDDVVLLVPSYVAHATGELLVIRFLEALIAAGVIRPDDVQKAAEHFV
jgi:hypothetical protein